MYELSLFSGSGGGLLATKWLLNWTCVGYVEFDDYCQRILAQRIKDGLLDNAPIFTDIKAFIDQGCCELYRKITEVITGGFPCQDISCAGRGKGLEGERSGLWQKMATVVSKVRPNYVLVENSPALTYRGLGVVLRDLATMGYNARWGCLSAQQFGANHKRDRIWLVAYTTSVRSQIDRGRVFAPTWWGGPYIQLFDDPQRGPFNVSKHISMDDGMASDVDELKAIGNGQVPAVAASAWNILTQDFSMFSTKSNSRCSGRSGRKAR